MNEDQAKHELGLLREKIDQLDRQLIDILNERTSVVEQIGSVKRNYQLPVYEPKREDMVYENVSAHNKGPLPQDAAKRIIERIMDEMRTLQRNKMAKDPNQQS